MSDDLPIVKIPRDPDGAVRMTADETARLTPGVYRYVTAPRPETLAEVIADTWGWTCSDDILAMPELQAIRNALRDMADNIAGEFTGVDGRDVTAADVLTGYLPPSVVTWVLDGESP